MNNLPCRVSADLAAHELEQDKRLEAQEMREEEINAIAVPILLDRIRKGAPEFWEGLSGEGMSFYDYVEFRAAIVVAVDCLHGNNPDIEQKCYTRLGRVIAEQVSDYMMPIVKGEL